jgi:hypothetical protein
MLLVPSALPADPGLPTTVLTTPEAVTLRIVWLFLSATYTVPAESTARPRGESKRASLPDPSVLPDELGLPANVLTTPLALTLRIV